ncbi:tautomerase family protein [Nocardia araoensis]|uniref:tautomerase family protein n=1 Tax=Nocardia araoensis TaxID=228600 RepID=UPI0002D84E24|nr:4-oxalocrotonate tautomerase family protein [Nocardia araoensis]
MPIIQVSLVEKHQTQELQEFARAVTEAASRFLGAPGETVRILIDKYSPELFFIAGETYSDYHAESAASAYDTSSAG